MMINTKGNTEVKAISNVSKFKYAIEDNIPVSSPKSVEFNYSEEIEFMNSMKIGQSFKFPFQEANKFKTIARYFVYRHHQLFTIKKIDSYNLRIWKLDYASRVRRPKKRKSAQL